MAICIEALNNETKMVFIGVTDKDLARQGMVHKPK
jgi:hypothetical protein